jgi:hypothetical protein
MSGVCSRRVVCVQAINNIEWGVMALRKFARDSLVVVQEYDHENRNFLN